MINNEEYLWVEKYRPKRVEDCVLPERLKKELLSFEVIPNLLLTGTAGIGKTTAAIALVEQRGCDWIKINASLKGNIDTLRTEILQFASTMSFGGERKYVILDEADNLNADSTQKALRAFIEEFSGNCGFIMTANYPNKLIEPLRSRMALVDFKIPKAERGKIAQDFFKRVKTILTTEQVEFDPKVVAEVINKFFPDFRRVINELQRYAAFGKIDSGILADLIEASLSDLIAAMKVKDFDKVRKWVNDNSDSSPNDIFRQFYDKAQKFMPNSSIPQLVLILADYQYKSAFVVDQEINLAACLTEIMADCVFTP